MTVLLGPAGRVRTCVYVSHVYAVIYQAADRIAQLIRRRALRLVSP